MWRFRTPLLLLVGGIGYFNGCVHTDPDLTFQASPESDGEKKGRERESKRDKDQEKDKENDKSRGKTHSDSKQKSPKRKAAKEEVGSCSGHWTPQIEPFIHLSF